jgi:hypothetical protein
MKALPFFKEKQGNGLPRTTESSGKVPLIG